jgi:hypothetical protein
MSLFGMIAEHRRKAEAASDGPLRVVDWCSEDTKEAFASIVNASGEGTGRARRFTVITTSRNTLLAMVGNGPHADANAAYIAANDPDTILALLAVAEEAKRLDDSYIAATGITGDLTGKLLELQRVMSR